MKENLKFIGYHVDGGIVEAPQYQQGGSTKKTIYVGSKNDPRYKAYQDSLNLYNKYENKKKALKNPVTTKYDAVNDPFEYDSDHEIYRDFKRTGILPTKQYTQKSNGFNGTGRYSYGFDKPKQKVELKQPEKPEEEVIPDMPKVDAVKLPPLKIDNPVLNIPENLVESNNPVSYNINYNAPDLSGGQMPIEEEFLDNRNVSPEELRNIIKRKNNYNNYIEEKYGNEEALKNPKAVERLEKLKQSIEITPNYKQQGGKITLSDGLRTSLETILKTYK